MVCPEGAPATAETATGDETVAPFAGVQIVTVFAVGEHPPPPPPEPTVMDSFDASTVPPLVHALIVIACVPAARFCEVLREAELVEKMPVPSTYSFIAVMVWPEGGPATAEKVTGEVTVAPLAGAQIVTAFAVGEHPPPPPEVPTVIVSFDESTVPPLVHAVKVMLCVPLVRDCEVLSEADEVENFDVPSIYNFIAVIVCPEGAPATAENVTGDETVEPGVGEQIVTAPAVGVHPPPPPPVPTVIVSDACCEAPVSSQATTTTLCVPVASV